MEDPKTAIDSILETAKVDKASNAEVKPLTIARYALLELVKSPFVTPGEEFTVLSIVPTLFIMLNDVEQLRGYTSANVQELRDKALVWSESIDIDSMSSVLEDIQEKVMRMLKVAPSSSAPTNAKKKA